MTKLARMTRAGAFTAMFAIVGVTAVMASAKTARAWDRQESEATQDDAINRQVAGQDAAVAPRPGPYASVHQGRRIETPAATHKDFQDIK
jgi:hypothetical protein